MKTPHRLMYEVLSPLEYKLFCRNLFKHRLELILNTYYRNDRIVSINAGDILRQAFPWHNAPEGGSFWINLYCRIYDQE